MATSEPHHKNVKRLSFVALIFAAIVFGLLAGLGGSMLLTHSLIQRPLQEQQAHINQQHALYQQEIIRLQQEIGQQHETIGLLKEEIKFFIMADSTGYLKELAIIQKENKNREQVFLQEIEQLKKQVERLDYSNQEFSKAVEEARRELERTDNSLRDDFRSLQSSMNDLKNQIQQLERQIVSR